MKNYVHFIITFFLFSLFFDTQSSMTIKDIKNPKFVFWISDDEYVIGGENGCIRDSCNQNKPLTNKQPITQEKVHYISINKNKTLLGVSLETQDHRVQQVLFNLEGNSTSDITFSNYFYMPTTFSSTHNFLLACKDGNLVQYDWIHKTTAKNSLPRSDVMLLTTALPEHHPISDKLLYRSYDKGFTIINRENPLTTPTTIECDDHIQNAVYSPNGRFLVIERHDSHYFICDLNTNETTIKAYILTHGNEKYVACAFHPKESIIALLSTYSQVHYFNYITRQCIARMPTTSTGYIPPLDLSKRLNICPNGKKLLVALKNECNILLGVPQNNVVDIYSLLKKEIPIELNKYIFRLLMALYGKNYWYFDFNELLRVQSMDTMDTIDTLKENKNDKIESTQNSKIIHVSLIPKSLAKSDSSGNFCT